MNDPDIRKILYPHILSMSDEKSLHVPEVWMGYSVADVLSLNVESSRIVGWEIKSDVDSLSRLKKQVKDYNKFCHECWIVTTDKYVDKVIEYIDPHWGIINVNESSMKIVKKAVDNPFFETRSVLSWLDNRQLKKILRSYGAKGYSGLSKYSLVQFANEFNDENMIKKCIEMFLVDKHYWISRAIK